jgi:hypothetical protein
MKASVFEFLSRFGRLERENDIYTVCFRISLFDAPIPFSMAYKAASSMSVNFPVIPFAPTAYAFICLLCVQEFNAPILKISYL